MRAWRVSATFRRLASCLQDYFKTLMTAEVQAFMQAHPVPAVHPAQNTAGLSGGISLRLTSKILPGITVPHFMLGCEIARQYCQRAGIAYLVDLANKQALQQLRDTAATLQGAPSAAC